MISRLVVLTLTLSAVVVVLASSEHLTCENIDNDLTPGKVIAIGARKQISEAYSARLGPVLIAAPWNGTWYRARVKDKQRDAAYLAYVVGERDELRAAANHDQMPRLYGGCWHDLWSSRTVVEYVEGWLTLIDDVNLDFNQRLVIAAKSLDLLNLFDHFPIAGPGGARRVLLHEYHPQMFAVNATYDIKLVSHNQQRLVYYSGKTAFGADFSCDSDRDCRVHFVDAKQIGAGLLLPEPPLDFSCDKDHHRCRGLDSRLNLYAIAHVLWKPLFGLDGHPLVGGIVSDFFRPKIQQIVDAAGASDPSDRPPSDDLRRALLGLVRGQVAPFFVPKNEDVQTFTAHREKADKVLHGASQKDAPRWDVPDEVELPQLSHAEKPIVLSNWFFKFQPTPQMPMTVRLLGVFNEQPWGSSPIYVRQNATLLRTRSGKAYMLRGAVNCEGLKTEGFSDEFCHKFHYGFPSRWKETLSDAWDKVQNAMRKQFFSKNGPSQPLQFDAANWLDPSELSVSDGNMRSDDFEVAVSDDSDTDDSAFSVKTKAKSGGVSHAAWLSTTEEERANAKLKSELSDVSVTAPEVAGGPVSAGDAAATKKLLADEKAERDRLAAIARKSPCGSEGLEAEGVCCLTSCGTCGGAHCESHTGGRAGCCPDQIHRSNLACSDNLPPCILRPIVAATAQLPQRVAPPSDVCAWSPADPINAPYDIDERGVLLTASSIGATRCIIPQNAVHVGLIPQVAHSHALLVPNPGRLTIDIAVTVTSTPLELVVAFGNGTSLSFQEQIAVFRFNGETNKIDVARDESKGVDRSAFHAVEKGRTFNIRAIVSEGQHVYDVQMRDFIGGAPPMLSYAKAVPFVSSAPASAFKSSAVAVGGVVDVSSCARRLGFATLLRRGGATVCFAPLVTTDKK